MAWRAILLHEKLTRATAYNAATAKWSQVSRALAIECKAPSNAKIRDTSTLSSAKIARSNHFIGFVL